MYFSFISLSFTDLAHILPEIDTIACSRSLSETFVYGLSSLRSEREVKHSFILQGLLRCGWCGNYMSTKYSTGRKGLHYYYQCTKNAHGGKSACDMRYVPASELEKAVLNKLKEMSTDKKRIQRIVNEANKDTASTLISLKKDSKIQENKLAPIKNSIKNILNNMAKEERLKNRASVSEELSRLELQREQIEKDIQAIDFEINQVKQQVLSAKVTHSISTASSYFFFEGTRIKRSISLFLKSAPLAKEPNNTIESRLKSVFRGNTDNSFSIIENFFSLFFKKSSAIFVAIFTKLVLISEFL